MALALMRSKNVRPRGGLSQRVFIWGALEARLQSVDVMILGGLNEGTWPGTARSDAFLSRIMRSEIDLDPPERRIGLAAHDLWMALGCKRVLLARSHRAGGAPAIPSRWLQRILTLAGPEGAKALRTRGQTYLHHARRLDERPPLPPAPRPEPKPPLEARPIRHSFTEVETLVRDPYAVFARRVLRLDPLPEMIRAPGAPERGDLYHAILHRFVAEGGDPNAEDARDGLLAIAREEFDTAALPAEIEAVWWPRMETLATNMIAWERERAPEVAERLTEVKGAFDLPGIGVGFHGYADRIDRMRDGSVEIIDYKTGTNPSVKQARTLLSPQLALEGAMARLGGFDSSAPSPRCATSSMSACASATSTRSASPTMAGARANRSRETTCRTRRSGPSRAWPAPIATRTRAICPAPDPSRPATSRGRTTISPARANGRRRARATTRARNERDPSRHDRGAAHRLRPRALGLRRGERRFGQDACPHERVVRLLLAGAEPSKILCLTYTKAAAAEMQTRVFARLSHWAVTDEETLEKAIEDLDKRRPSKERLAEARRLFARALEAPGGLKIQTIHAFCEAVLHQFPLEANIPGHFEVMDETESALLLAEARRMLIAGAQTRPDDPGGQDAEDAAIARAFADALSMGGEWGLDALLSEIVQRRDRLRRHLEAVGGREAAEERLRRALGLGPGETEESALAGAIDPPGFEESFREALAEAAQRSGKATDTKLAGKIALIESAETPEARFAALCSVVFKADGGRYKASSVATKAVSGAFPDFEERLEALGEFLEERRERLATLRLARASGAALTIAEKLEADYASLKRRRGRLDFEDLIVRTADLLLRAEASAWVHFKLDQGIDHVLVDEAQDTSPRQWQVVRQLVEEFFAGASASVRPRTVFAVGDEKQSIYSFQGASPEMFARERRYLRSLAEGGDRPFAAVELHQSFRSVPDILKAVDQVFADPADRRGLQSEDGPPVHVSTRTTDPGLIEVWPSSFRHGAQHEDWLTPVDLQPESSPAHRLATRIAARIGDWIGRPIRAKGRLRPLDAGDVLILVRKRSGFVSAMGAALRKAGIPVAGADRLVITDHIAVSDLVALGRTVSNAEDELSLAAVLKSPLFGFSDDELMALALSRRSMKKPEALYFALRRLARPGGAERIPDFVKGPARETLRKRPRKPSTGWRSCAAARASRPSSPSSPASSGRRKAAPGSSPGWGAMPATWWTPSSTSRWRRSRRGAAVWRRFSPTSPPRRPRSSARWSTGAARSAS